MAKKSNQSFFSDIPPMFKGIIALVVLVGGGYVLVKTIQKRLSIQDLKDQMNDEQKELKEINQKATISKSQAQSLSNSLQAAMSGYGSDESAIYSIFEQLKNNADYLLLSTTYGIRTLSSGAYNPAPDFTGTLSASLVEELSQTERNKVNAILKKKGIKFLI